MTHDERVWELYRGFTIAEFHNCQFDTDTPADHEILAKEYHAMAETFSTAFERLSAEEAERTRTDSPFENRVPDFEVTAKED